MKAIVFLSSYDLHNYFEFYSEDQSPINLVNLTKHSQYLINKDIEKRRIDYLYIKPTKRFGVWV
jgi:hypothetical protein